jgi:hypothetical protein
MKLQDRLVPVAIWLAYLGGSVIWGSLAVAGRGISRRWGFFLMLAVCALNAVNAAFLLSLWGGILFCLVSAGFGIALAVARREGLPRAWFAWMASAAAAYLFPVFAAYLFRKQEIR